MEDNYFNLNNYVKNEIKAKLETENKDLKKYIYIKNNNFYLISIEDINIQLKLYKEIDKKLNETYIDDNYRTLTILIIKRLYLNIYFKGNYFTLMDELYEIDKLINKILMLINIEKNSKLIFMQKIDCMSLHKNKKQSRLKYMIYCFYLH